MSENVFWVNSTKFRSYSCRNGSIPAESGGIQAIPVPFQCIPVLFRWNLVESGGMDAFLQESVGHQKVQHISCPTYPSPQSYAPSSQISTLSSPLQVLVNTPRHTSCPNPPVHSQTVSAPLSTLSLTVGGRNSSPVPPPFSQEHRPWNMPLPISSSEKRPRPAPYCKSLVPLPSPLRLHCPANQRLRLWRPLVPRDQRSSQVSDEDLKRIQDIMAHAWELDTHATYASSLLNFMVFCDQKNIPEKDRAPASQLLIMSFISTLAAAYSGSAISNYVYGVWAWHLLHSIPWKISKPELEALLKVAEKLNPSSSRRKKRRPYTTDFMLAIWNNLDLDSPLGASAFTCLTTCFSRLVVLGSSRSNGLTASTPSFMCPGLGSATTKTEKGSR